MKLMLMLIPTCALFLVSANAGAVENRSLHRGKPEAQECSLRKAKRLLEEQSAQSEKGKRSGTEVKAS